MSSDIESSLRLQLDFSKIQSIDVPVVPVVVQHADSKEVLILAYVNEDALALSLEKKEAVFWSTSRNEIWHKGKTSGDYLEIVDIKVNCEQNSLVFLVNPKRRGVCHTKDASGKHRTTCYYRSLETEPDTLRFTEP